MRWVHDRTVDGMNAGTDVHTLMREVRVPDHLDVGEGYGQTEVERAGDLGELRRLVPPPLHHRALRRDPARHRPRPGGRCRRRRTGRRGTCTPRRRPTGRGPPAHRPRAGRRAGPRGRAITVAVEAHGCCSGPPRTSGSRPGCAGRSRSWKAAHERHGALRLQRRPTVLVTGGTSGIGHAHRRRGFADAGGRRHRHRHQGQRRRLRHGPRGARLPPGWCYRCRRRSTRWRLARPARRAGQQRRCHHARLGSTSGAPMASPPRSSSTSSAPCGSPPRVAGLLFASDLAGGASVVNLASMAAFRGTSSCPATARPRPAS